MDFTQKQNIRMVSALLLFTALSQAIYTLLYVVAKDVPRLWLWGIEGVVFVLLAAIAGAALVQAKNYSLGFSAIMVSAILNLIQVSIGLTQFGAFREAAQNIEGIAPAAGGVVAFSFFIYNGAKVLLGLSAIVFGTAVLQSGSKLLGRLTILVGAIALSANAIVMVMGRIQAIPSGATGVVATLLLAICVYKLASED